MGKRKVQKGSKRSKEGSKEAIRRSSRLKSSVLPQVDKPAVKHVNLDEIENEEEENNVLPGTKTADANLVENENEETMEYQTVCNNLKVENERTVEKEAPHNENTDTVPVVNEENMDEECIIRSADELNSKTRTTEGSSADLSYRSLYIDSQKAIQVLMKEHYEVVKKLEYANGKIDAYEKMILVSRGDKDAEAQGSFQRIHKRISAAVADDDQNAYPKQKRTYKKKKRVHFS